MRVANDILVSEDAALAVIGPKDKLPRDIQLSF